MLRTRSSVGAGIDSWLALSSAAELDGASPVSTEKSPRADCRASLGLDGRDTRPHTSSRTNLALSQFA